MSHRRRTFRSPCPVAPHRWLRGGLAGPLEKSQPAEPTPPSASAQSRCPAPLSWKQGFPHDDRVLVGPIILEHRAGEDRKLGKPELPPQTPGHLVLRKDQVEDHAPISQFCRVLQHHGPQEPAQPLVAPLGRHYEPRVGDVAGPARPAPLETEGADQVRPSPPTPPIGADGACAPEPARPASVPAAEPSPRTGGA